MSFLKLKKKLTNTRTIMALFSLVVLVLTTWGVKIPLNELDITVRALCSIGVILGVMNDKGMDTVKWDK